MVAVVAFCNCNADTDCNAGPDRRADSYRGADCNAGTDRRAEADGNAGAYHSTGADAGTTSPRCILFSAEGDWCSFG